MRATASLLAVAVVTVAAVAPVRADDALAEAVRLKDALEYDRALAIVDRLLAGGGADPQRLVALHVLAGTLAAGLDRPAVAEDHFARALALQPGVTLPEGTSPKIVAPFAAARARHVALHVSAALADGVVTLAVGPDPLGLVAGLQVDAVDPAGRHLEVMDARGRRVELPGGLRAREVRALDASGNRVWIGRIDASGTSVIPVSRGAADGESSDGATDHGDAATRVTAGSTASGAATRPGGGETGRGPTTPPGTVGATGVVTPSATGAHAPAAGVVGQPAAAGPAFYRRWSTWAALGGVALAVGGVSAWRFEVAQHDWNQLRAEDGQHDYSELRAVEQRGRRWGVAADFGFAVAGGAAIAAVVAYLTRPSEAPAVTVMASPGAIGLAGRF